MTRTTNTRASNTRNLGLAIACTSYVVLASIALRSAPTYDFGLAYSGGVVAWESGRPESLPTWISTPVLGAVIAVLTQVMSATAAAALLTLINMSIATLGLGICLYQLHPVLSKRLWWTTVVLSGLYAPLLSSTWWKQFNILALALAALGWQLLRSSRLAMAAGLIALSVMLKPIVVLVPVLLLLRRDLRKAGLWCAIWALVMLAASKFFMLLRGGTLSPLPDLRKFADSSKPANIWSCHPENLSPTSYACRLMGSGSFGIQRLVIAVTITILGFALWQAYRWRPSVDWAWFAGACVLSPMISPIAWTHYQIVLLPAFFVVLFNLNRLPETKASLLAVLGLAYVGCSLSLQPYGSIFGTIQSRFFNGAPENSEQTFARISFAGAAQWLLLLTLFQIGGPSSARIERSQRPKPRTA